MFIRAQTARFLYITETLIPELRIYLTKIAQLHNSDVVQGNGLEPMPNALYQKYPSASQSLAWQFVFPSSLVRPWRETGKVARWHASPSTLRRAFKYAVDQPKIYKHVGPHTLRYSFA